MVSLLGRGVVRWAESQCERGDHWKPRSKKPSRRRSPACPSNRRGRKSVGGLSRDDKQVENAEHGPAHSFEASRNWKKRVTSSWGRVRVDRSKKCVEGKGRRPRSPSTKG